MQGALLGAGASLIGVGSDIAGSIRVPCLFNGIFGHKPSPGKFFRNLLYRKFLIEIHSERIRFIRINPSSN